MSLRMTAQTMLIFRFASGAESGGEVTHRCIVFDGYQSRHVESLAQVAVALFA